MTDYLVSLLFYWIQWQRNSGSTVDHFLIKDVSLTLTFVKESLEGRDLTVTSRIYPHTKALYATEIICQDIEPLVTRLRQLWGVLFSHSRLITAGSHRLDWCVITRYAHSLCRENSPGCRSGRDQIPHYITLCSSRIHTRRVPLLSSWSPSLCKQLSALQQVLHFPSFVSG